MPRCWRRRASSDKDDGQAIREGLLTVVAEIETGKFIFRAALEDIHMNVEARLNELIGEPAGRLHTARSRNDQVATDFRLWVRDAIDGLPTQICATLKRRWSSRPRRTPTRSCPASRICRPPSR